ncbi:MAG: response regulator [Bradyrhizobium sp.]|uniref:response regulator n=1 Tax=Bradyrhizobium sp. TaxID=376 RepID=UPI003C7C69A8
MRPQPNLSRTQQHQKKSAFCRFFSRLLEDIGSHVIRASSGSEALELLQRNDSISILITEINMPGMDGHELAERATHVRPALKILQLSGRERRQGGFPMIRKPFSQDDLVRVMQQTTGAC